MRTAPAKYHAPKAVERASLPAFLATMADLRARDQTMYRAVLGIARAMYTQSNPTAPRGKEARAMHMRIASKVRPIDDKRARALRVGLARSAS